jgi:hypothetical protein
MVISSGTKGRSSVPTELTADATWEKFSTAMLGRGGRTISKNSAARAVVLRYKRGIGGSSSV